MDTKIDQSLLEAYSRGETSRREISARLDTEIGFGATPVSRNFRFEILLRRCYVGWSAVPSAIKTKERDAPPKSAIPKVSVRNFNVLWCEIERLAGPNGTKKRGMFIEQCDMQIGRRYICA
jgi:hypothetical protein